MLKMPEPFLKDKKANAIVEKYINGRLLNLLKTVLFDWCPEGYPGIQAEDAAFIDFISVYFPEIYPRNKMSTMFFGLYALLDAEDKFVPELVMEYVLHNLIETEIELCDDTDVSTVEPMKERKYVLSKLKEEYQDMEYEEGDEPMTAEELLEQMEDMREYLEICFWDRDYEFLDYFTEEALMASQVNEDLGIGLEEKDNIFMIPKEWRK